MKKLLHTPKQAGALLKILLKVFLFILFYLTLGSFLGLVYATLFLESAVTLSILMQVFLFTFTLFLIMHSSITLFWMLYAWQDPENSQDHKSPETYSDPYYSFTALLPVRHEERVVVDTIHAIDKIDYPNSLKEIVVLCRSDDVRTIAKVHDTIEKIGNPKIRIEIFHDDPINKPHALNKGLNVSDHTIISVFDAEDEPHPDIYHIVNTVMKTKDVDVIQSGVQLMNYQSQWFSALNCLEYYFWFKSGLHFFNKFGKASPLGGNTVFFKRRYLETVGGWDEQCLTEDADIGFRLIQSGAKIHILYDEAHVTKEETPNSLSSFIKQRTRWNQGFLQIFFKFNWLHLPKTRQKLVASYILLFPLLQALLFLYIPFAIYFGLTIKLPIALALFSFIPLFLFFLQVIAQIVGLYHFTKSYNLKFSILMICFLIVCLIPYLMVLAFSSVRAVCRFFFGSNVWEKTAHVNAHREPAVQLLYVK